MNFGTELGTEFPTRVIYAGVVLWQLYFLNSVESHVMPSVHLQYTCLLFRMHPLRCNKQRRQRWHLSLQPGFRFASGNSLMSIFYIVLLFVTYEPGHYFLWIYKWRCLHVFVWFWCALEALPQWSLSKYKLRVDWCTATMTQTSAPWWIIFIDSCNMGTRISVSCFECLFKNWHF